MRPASVGSPASVRSWFRRAVRAAALNGAIIPKQEEYAFDNNYYVGAAVSSMARAPSHRRRCPPRLIVHDRRYAIDSIIKRPQMRQVSRYCEAAADGEISELAIE